MLSLVTTKESGGRSREKTFGEKGVGMQTVQEPAVQADSQIWYTELGLHDSDCDCTSSDCKCEWVTGTRDRISTILKSQSFHGDNLKKAIMTTVIFLTVAIDLFLLPPPKVPVLYSKAKTYNSALSLASSMKSALSNYSNFNGFR
jgi:hypothetical protein